MTTAKLLLLRIFMILFGRFMPNLIRKVMQKILINKSFNKRRYFSREFLFSNNNLEIIDRYRISNREKDIARVIETNFENNKHVIMSKIFHPYFLQIKSPIIKNNFKYKNFIFSKRKWD